MEISAANNQALKNGIPSLDFNALKNLDANKNLQQTEKLNEVDRQFESMLVRSMLKDSFKNMKQYDQFATDIFADAITGRERLFGINIASQFKTNQ